jgi:hypothetical protein
MKFSFSGICLFLSLSCWGQKFKYEVKKDVTGIALYTLVYDSRQQLGYLYGSNLYVNGVFYPVSHVINLKSAVKFRSKIPLNSQYYEMLSLIEKMEPVDDFMLAKSFADSSDIQSVDSLKNNWAAINWLTGGELYDREYDELICDSCKVFYVSFGFEGDILVVHEDREWNFSMCCGWFCKGSYKYTANKSDPTAFLLKLKKDYPLTEEQREFLHLRPMPKFSYEFSYCY